MPTDQEKMLNNLPDVIKERISGMDYGDQLEFIDNLDSASEQIWINDLPSNAPKSVRHEQYHSLLMNQEIGYSIYLPPSYNSSNKNYPVIYFLHSIGESEISHLEIADFTSNLINESKCPEAIVVFINGGFGSVFANSFNGKILVESTIIKELISHIDENYRTDHTRRGRKIMGYGDGGNGALRLSLKFSYLFSAVVTYGGTFYDLKTYKKKYQIFYDKLFSSRDDYYEENSIYKALDYYSGYAARFYPVKIRIIIGKKDQAAAFNNKIKELLDKKNINFEYHQVSIKDNNLDSYLQMSYEDDLRFLIED